MWLGVRIALVGLAVCGGWWGWSGLCAGEGVSAAGVATGEGGAWRGGGLVKGGWWGGEVVWWCGGSEVCVWLCCWSHAGMGGLDGEGGWSGGRSTMWGCLGAGGEVLGLVCWSCSSCEKLGWGSCGLQLSGAPPPPCRRERPGPAGRSKSSAWFSLWLLHCGKACVLIKQTD